jgi:hypothetical protein
MTVYLINILSMINENNRLTPKFTYIVGDKADIHFYETHKHKTVYSTIELSESALKKLDLQNYNKYVRLCNQAKGHSLYTMEACIPKTFERVLEVSI